MIGSDRLRFLRTFICAIALLPWLLCAEESSAGSQSPDTLILATTEWCPYVCNDKEKPGIIFEYLREILQRNNIALEVDFFPWSRAIELARSGRYDGLLTAARLEAPDFIFPDHPVSHYRMCFFRRVGEEFEYTGLQSIEQKVVGLSRGYSYGAPVDGYVQRHAPSPYLTIISQNEPIDALVNMLLLSRIETFIEDPWVLTSKLREHPAKGRIEEAGCLKIKPFYTVLSPDYPYAKKVLGILNAELQSETNQLRQLDISAKYFD